MTLQFRWYAGQAVTPLLPALGDLLADAVTASASIGFVWPVDMAEIAAYWLGVDADVQAGKKHLLVVHDAMQQLVATAQLEPAAKANGRHRAEVQKVIVHTTCRGQGIGTQVMQAVDAQARALHRSLLVLDTRAGDAGERLYQATGWVKVGELPGYAISPDTLSREATAFYYKRLD